MLKWKYRIGQFQFSTLVSIAQNNPLDIDKNILIKKISSSSNPFSFNPIVIVADPFLFVHNDQIYLFYEEQKGLNGKGIIKMTKTSDLKNWSTPTTVLEEPFHLSFPNVFTCDGVVYMIPETGFNNSLSLYKPDDNFIRWTHYKTLLSGLKFTDSSIVKYENYYYLFTTDYTSSSNVLRLYYSDSIDGEWVEHPKSPIANGKNTGRCAGSVFYYNNILYRPCQLTKNRYGEGVVLYQIKTLNLESYEEIYIKSIIPNNNKYYRLGGHHFNFCKFQDKVVVATDIFELKLNYFEIIKRLYYKIMPLKINTMFCKIKKCKFKSLILIILERLIKIKVIKLHYLKANINLEFTDEDFKNLPYEIKELNYNDFLLGDKSIFSVKKLNIIRQRLDDESYKAYGIIQDNILIYSTWISLKHLGLPIPSKFVLNPNEGLLEDSYCHPIARGKGIHSIMNKYRLNKLHKFGKEKCIAIVASGNLPAFKVQFKSGFKEYGVFFVIKFWGISFTTLNKKRYDCK